MARPIFRDQNCGEVTKNASDSAADCYVNDGFEHRVNLESKVMKFSINSFFTLLLSQFIMSDW